MIRARYAGDRLLESFGLLVMLIALAALSVLVYDVLHDGLTRISWTFLTSEPSRRAEAAGIYTAIVGTIYVIGLTTLISVPIGVAAAIHLEEYGGRGRMSRIIEINIANLAGVPSIIYGLLGLGLFVRAMRMGPSVLAGASTLALLEAQPDVVKRAQSAGLTVTAYTFRSASAGRFPSVRDEMSHYLYTLGIDAVFTDNPDQFPRK